VFVLIHGAFHGGWCWRFVAERLTAAGARVFTPTMTGLGERAHLLSPTVGLETFIADAIGVIAAEELDGIILVGHSFGGIVISAVADRMPSCIRHLVYLDALIPKDGCSALSRLPEATAVARVRAARASLGGLGIPAPPAAAFDVPAGPARDWLQRRLTPHPLAAYADPIRLAHPVGNGLKRTYIRCAQPIYETVRASHEAVAADPAWTCVDLQTGHDAMITAPDALADLLLGLAAQSE
jgi:pimeloyl-ACP methyl ester carboxylesterase